MVGIRKNNKKAEPIFWFPPNTKNPEPKARHMIAPTKRIDAIWSGIPFEDINSTVFEKPIILPGIADINIDEIATLAKNQKKFWYPYF